MVIRDTSHCPALVHLHGPLALMGIIVSGYPHDSID